MIIGVAVELAVGLLIVGLGLVLWEKQKISLLHSYHYSNVRKEDYPAFTRRMGIGLIVIGIGICLTGLLNLLYSPLWWVPLFGGIGAGIAILDRTERKYNGTWFG